MGVTGDGSSALAAHDPPSATYLRGWQWGTLPAAGLIVAAALGVYSNSFRVPFLLDDPLAIVDNPTIRQLWPIWQALLPPADRSAVDRRPVTNLSLAVNYALGGTEVWGYHALNLAAHVLAALTLFGVLRRSLRRPIFAERFGAAATPLALIATLIWTVHPLQTNAVTYVIQRTEVLAGLFYLLTLYCVIRGAEQGSGFGVQGWYAAAVVSCLLAVGSKESAVSAPVVVLLYDRLFLARSWREVWNRRRGLYLGLAATWGLTVGMLVRDGLNPRPGMEDVGQRAGYGPWLEYALLQGESIALYLRLCFWPRPLILDYGMRHVSHWGEVAPYAAMVLTLAAGTAAALWYGVSRPGAAAGGGVGRGCRSLGLGFLGLWFFAILAPSSGVVPITPEWAAEKRMYLPLAAVVTATVAAVVEAARALAGGRRKMLAAGACVVALGVAAIGLGAVAHQRNEAYRSELSIWSDTVEKAPRNSRARNNLGLTLLALDRTEEAIGLFRIALDLNPRNALAHNNLGMALKKQKKTEEAVAHYRAALEINPDLASADNNLGNALLDRGQLEEAVSHFRRALAANPGVAPTHVNLGLALGKQKKRDAAIAEFREALRIDPRHAEAHYRLANALSAQGKIDEAVEWYQKALATNPEYAEAHNNLGVVLERQNKAGEAIEHYRRAVQLNPQYVDAHSNLAMAELSRGQAEAAIASFQKALELNPRLASCHLKLGALLLQKGELGGAIQHSREAVAIEPSSADARFQLARACFLQGHVCYKRGQGTEAFAQWRETIRLQPEAIPVLNLLAWELATCPNASLRNGKEALELAQRGARVTGDQAPELLDTLAAAYAESGRFDRAARTAAQALDLATRQGDQSLAAALRGRLELYRHGTPFRDPKSPLAPKR
jgi:tetratricopeptide (TPR) repeat protein